jgi:hypothetical protein
LLRGLIRETILDNGRLLEIGIAQNKGPVFCPRHCDDIDVVSGIGIL